MKRIQELLRKFRDERDWAQFHTPKDLAISVSIEAGELLELFQWGHEGHNVEGVDRDRIADEAADVLLYTLMLFDRMGLDAETEALKKIHVNEQRFPVELSYGRSKSRLKA